MSYVIAFFLLEAVFLLLALFCDGILSDICDAIGLTSYVATLLQPVDKGTPRVWMTDSHCPGCLDEAPERPVITDCGHQHCWPCLLEWANTCFNKAPSNFRSVVKCTICRGDIKTILPMQQENGNKWWKESQWSKDVQIIKSANKIRAHRLMVLSGEGVMESHSWTDFLKNSFYKNFIRNIPSIVAFPVSVGVLAASSFISNQIIWIPRENTEVEQIGLICAVLAIFLELHGSFVRELRRKFRIPAERVKREQGFKFT